MIEEKDEQDEKVEDPLEEASDLLEKTKDQFEEVKGKILLGPLIADYRGGVNQLLELVKEALEASSDVNDDSRNGHRPLQLAIRGGHTEVACLLIEAGADLKFRDRSGSDPINTAINHGQFKVARLLIKKGVSCPSMNPYNYTQWYKFHFG